MPGLSRSGTTITACLVSGFDKRFAVKYSFLMAVPAVLGASVLEIKDAVAEEITGNLVLCCVIGAVVAGLVGYVCIKVMLSIVRKKKFKGFAIYCLVLGVAAIAAHFIL